MKKLSTKVMNVKVSATLNQSDIIDTLKKTDKKIYKLNIGEPYIKTPQNIIDATKKALDEGETHYSKVSGLKELKSGIVNKLKEDNQIENINNTNIMVSNGSKEILYLTFQALLDKGDELIVVKPYWVTYTESIKLAGGVPVIVAPDSDFKLNVDNIAKAITPKTKAVIINSPNNPSGAIYTKESLKAISKLCIEKDIMLISDEAYETLAYDGKVNYSPASFSTECFNNTITIQTFSKGYCMTGFRVGYAVANQDIIQALNKLQGHITGNVCTFAQFGAISAIKNRDFTIALRETYNNKKHIAYSLVKDFLKVNEPEGAFYLFCDISEYLEKFNMSSSELCDYMLKEIGVAVVPGDSFGYDNYIRISYSCSDEDLRESLILMKQFLTN